MAAFGFQDGLSRGYQAGDEITGGDFSFITFFALGDDHRQSFQSCQLAAFAQISQIYWSAGSPTLPHLKTAMVLSDMFGISEGALLKTVLAFHLKQVLQVFVEMTLVLFNRQQVIAALLDNLLGNFGLHTNGIHGYQATVQVQQP